MSERLIAAFRGSAHCRREAGAVQWCIVGLDRDNGAPLEVLLSGAAALQLPAQLNAAELCLRGESASAAWALRAGSESIPLAVRAVQVHRNAAAAFAGVLPRITAPWPVRAGWVLLLNLLHLPGMLWLLRAGRGRGAA